MGVVRKVREDGGNKHFTLECPFVGELKIDQSVSHNGVCLTVVELTEDTYTVTAIAETLQKSNLGLLHEGDKVICVPTHCWTGISFRAMSTRRQGA